MRKILFLACLIGMSSASWAQSDQSWTNLSTLYPGQKIQVVELNSKKHSGAFVSFSETSITFQDALGGQAIPRQNVRKVRLGASKRLLRNTLIAAGVGAGAGAGIGAAAWENHGFLGSKGVGATVGLAIGFIAGAVVGVLLPAHHTIYSANLH
jgi:hypothetical protein